ncbi:MAG: hypothetical protein ACLGGV_07130 [Bacteroidia bacterium]
MTYINSLEFAQNADKQDNLSGYRNRFHFPVIDGKQVLSSMSLSKSFLSRFILGCNIV